MFSKNLKYTLITLTLLGVSGCNQRTIILNPEARTSAPRVSSLPSESVVREEILINRNPNLGDRISVPVNNPSLGSVNSNESGHDANIDGEIDRAEMASERLNNGPMERMAFPVEEYARIPKRGYSTVTGSIYVENSNSGEKIMGKKVKLWLNPVTSYSNQWYEQDYLGGYKLSKIDKRIFNYMKLEYSKSNGSFRFSGVPRGEYYLVGSVNCTEACGLSHKDSKIRLVKRISVGSGVTRIDLMKNVP
jgi:hypothetical protein